MQQIISKLQADIDFKLSLNNTLNAITRIQLQKGSRNHSVLIEPLVDYSIQEVFGLNVSLGRYFLRCKPNIKHTFPKAKILNIPYCENYGHCLHDIIPKLMYEDLQSGYDVIYTCGSPVLNSLLDLFEIKFNKVILLNKDYVELEADEISLETHEAYHLRNKQKIKLLKNQIDTIIEQKHLSDITNRLIYCSRNGTNVQHGRQMCQENEADIICKLQEYCHQNNLVFTFFNGQENGVTMSHLQQLKLFSEAKIVVGPHGSAMANIIYLNPKNKCSICEFTSGTEVIIQNGSFFKHYNALYGFLSEEIFDYYLIPFSNNSTWNKTSIDLDNLTSFLQSTLE